MVRIPFRNAAAVIQAPLEKIKKPLEAATRPVIDKLESFRKPIDVRPPPPDFKSLIEKVAYKKSIEDMTPAELKEEALEVEEQLIESSTGRAQDPEAKAEAIWKRELIQAEMKRRVIEDPNILIEKYEALIKKLPDAALKDEVKRLQAELEDAKGGPHTNEADAAKIQEKLDAARSEQAQRVVDDPKTNLLSYMIATQNLSDKALTAEQAQVRGEYEKTLKQLEAHPEQARELRTTLEALASKLTVLDAAMKRRELTPATQTPPPVEPPPATETPAETAQTAPAEETPAAEPVVAGEPTGSEPYQIAEGDSLSAIAMKISEDNGGTPGWEAVMADILELNPNPNPDLIITGEWLQLPVYTRG